MSVVLKLNLQKVCAFPCHRVSVSVSVTVTVSVSVRVCG